jgi:hypothetical protein
MKEYKFIGMDDFEGKAVQRKMFALYERREFPFAEKLV